MTNTNTRAVTESRAVFLLLISLIYTIAIVIATLTLNPYFAKTWDVMTFIHAARTFTDAGSPFDLYAQSRAAQTWPYAYPPLHAFVTAIALVLGDLIRVLPDYVWARVPMILADIGIAIVLHEIVAKKTGNEKLARIAASLWLFNPITFYDTAVQGHFESEWIVFVLLAYLWHDEKRNIILPSIALALAVLFKQTAIIFAIPFWLSVLMDEKFSSFIPHPSSLKKILVSGSIFAFVVLLACLPFLLYSDDFVFMNLTYVENVPVQTQSWMVALLGITRESANAMTSDFFLLRYQTIVTMLATVVISFFAVRRNFSLYLTATLIALVFFLTSKKVMGYYYVMLFPFLFAELVTQLKWRLIAIVVAVTTWVSLSPYYASWTNHAHWWIYALLGTLNSLFFAWLFYMLSHLHLRAVQVFRAQREISDSEFEISRRQKSPPRNDSHGWLAPLGITIGLFATAFASAMIQPLAQNTSSPIRAPIIAPGTESIALIAFIVIAAFAIVSMIMMARIVTKNWQWRMVWSIVLVFAPIFFSVYYLTKESTAIFETVLGFLGV
jgi:hypothetical protein